MIDYPKISVITPSYNQGSYLEKTLQSVLDQKYPNIEYIVIDGGSKDESVEIIKKYEPYLYYWVSEPDKGQSDALNKGFKIATGEIIVWLNSDDWLDKKTLFTVADFFMKYPDRHIMNGMCTYVYADKNIPETVNRVGEVTFRKMVSPRRYGFTPMQPSVFFRRSVLLDVGLLNEKLQYTMDLDLWLRMSIKYKFFFVEQNFSYYYFHDASKSGSDNGFHKFRPEMRRVRMHYLKKASTSDKIYVSVDLLKSSVKYVWKKIFR